jgi:glycosyltransferase involved in cell wall biosynthesis
MNPKISIIIPAYQQAEYLEDCIESCYNQTKTPHEIIVINDGSTDETREIAERYMFKDFPLIDSPVKVINQVNKGLASARNTGIMAATGDYILPLDADDILRETAIATFTKEIMETNADIIAPSFVEFGKSDRQVIIEPFDMETFKKGNRIGYFCCVRRSALVECGGYSPKMKWGFEDYHIWFDLFSRGKTIAPIKDILVGYRVKERSMIHEANEHAEELHAQIRKDFPHLFK